MTNSLDIQQLPETNVNLSTYSQGDYSPGRGRLVRCLWVICRLLVFESGWCPFSGLKVLLLRFFGANIGSHVVIKPNVRIKFPWRLTIGNHVWIGQEVWIDNLAQVTLGDQVCLSQRVYLCTGSHNYREKSFDLITKPISVASGGWICAGAILLPGTMVGCEAIISAGSVVSDQIAPGVIMKGNPATQVGVRKFEETEKLVKTEENLSEMSE